MALQWFPGHMHKALKEIKESISQVDILIEVLDARIPYSSENPEIAKIRGDKPVLKILNKYDLADSLEIKKSNWFSNVEKKFDLIISNPPYLDSEEINFLDDEVKKYDPLISLDGGKNGLECYNIISKDIWKYLNVDGIVCLEIGFNQSKALQSIFEKQGLVKVLTKKDLLNKDRVIVFKK